MLRRKLMLMLGPVVVLLAIVSGVALWLLQGVLRDLKQGETQAWEIVERVNELGVAIDGIVAQPASGAASVPRVEAALRLVRRAASQVESHAKDPSECAMVCANIRAVLYDLESHLSRAKAEQAPDATLSLVAADTAALRARAVDLDHLTRARVDREQRSVLARFGAILLVMGLVFLVLINAASVALLRAALMVLRPVHCLIDGSRELAREHFDHRVHVKGAGEFSELAEAFNDLALRLQDQEKRRVEVMGQVALTLNHELNNALAVIELRLYPLARRAGGDAFTQKCLGEIRENLARMARTVESFKHVRRIVLTDYTSGVKMLDLEQSVRP